jgi:hypothetical protein
MDFYKNFILVYVLKLLFIPLMSYIEKKTTFITKEDRQEQKVILTKTYDMKWSYVVPCASTVHSICICICIILEVNSVTEQKLSRSVFAH